jgi:hypothetical protein
MRIIVTGSRHATDAWRDVIVGALSVFRAVHYSDSDGMTLVHGACHLGGVDLIAAGIASDWGWRVEPHPAQNHPTQNFGPWPNAGPKRNRYMCSLGAYAVLAFPGAESRGTWDCLKATYEYGIPFRGYPLVGCK